METRERVRHLIDHFSDDDLEVIEQFLDRLQESVSDPVQYALLKAATLEPEAVSEDDVIMLDEVSDDDEYISHEDVRSMFRSDR